MCDHTQDGVKVAESWPVMTRAAATIGVAALVPTIWTHCPPHTSRMPSVPSAAAEMSASIRFVQLV